MAKSDFLRYVAQVPASKWTEALFTLLDFEDNSEMSFADFLLVLSAYCMFDAHAIVKLIFFSFDRDKNGKLDMEELMELLVALHGKHLEQNVRLAVAAIDKADIDITYDQLQRINKVYPSMLYPALRMQVSMRHYAMGVKWWQNKMHAVVQYNKTLADVKDSNVSDNDLQEKASASANKKKNRMRLLSRKRYGFGDNNSGELEEEEEEEEEEEKEEDDDEQSLELSKAGLCYLCCSSRSVKVVAHAKKLKQLERQLNARLEYTIDNQLKPDAAVDAEDAVTHSPGKLS